MNKLALLSTAALILTAALWAAPAMAERDVIEKNITIIYFAEPSDYFSRGRLNYLYNYTDAAADNIRRGARSVANEAEAAEGDVRKALLESYTELNDLASSVESGDYVTVIDLNYAFSRALVNLSRQEVVIAEGAWKEDNYKDTGAALLVATNNLRQAYGWVQVKLGEDDFNAMADVRKAANTLRNGTKADAKFAFKKIKTLAGRLDKTLAKQYEEEAGYFE